MRAEGTGAHIAVGIDDTLAAAAAGIELSNTIVETIKRYRGKGKDPDLELLIEEVRFAGVRAQASAPPSPTS